MDEIESEMTQIAQIKQIVEELRLLRDKVVRLENDIFLLKFPGAKIEFVKTDYGQTKFCPTCGDYLPRPEYYHVCAGPFSTVRE